MCLVNYPLNGTKLRAAGLWAAGKNKSKTLPARADSGQPPRAQQPFTLNLVPFNYPLSIVHFSATFRVQAAELRSRRSVSPLMRYVDEKRTEEWLNWQSGVLAELRNELREHVGEIHARDVDWNAWLPLFLEGCSPRDAVDKAFVRH
jgi:hypothetical protein